LTPKMLFSLPNGQAVAKLITPIGRVLARCPLGIAWIAVPGSQVQILKLLYRHDAMMPVPNRLSGSTICEPARISVIVKTLKADVR